MLHHKLRPGQLAVSNIDADQLILWSSLECSIDEPHGYAQPDDVLLILEFREMSIDLRKFTSEEWIKGAYRVLAPSGQSGWIGAGWLQPLSGANPPKRIERVYEL